MSNQTPDNLCVGDLVMWTGKSTEYATFHRRIIYVVAEIMHPEDPSRTRSFKLRPAFDIESPIGTVIETTGYPVLSSYLKKLSLLDVASIRLHYDNFIKEWAKSQGLASPDEVR